MTEKKLPEVKFKEKKGEIRQIREYQLITPLFGGGVEPNKADPISTVRATEIRGHLRFWWRAIRGAVPDGKPDSMHKLEEKIWGSSGGENKPGASKVRIAIIEWNNGNEFQAVNYKGDYVKDVGDYQSIDSYITFPLRKKDAFLLDNVSFTLEIKYPDNYKKDVEAALWAWETFGGIGARTRRGLGAITCFKINGNKVQFPSDGDVLKKYIDEGFSRFSKKTGSFPAEVPYISENSYLKIVHRDYHNQGIDKIHPSKEIRIWREVVKQYKNFRQARPNQNDYKAPGRSHWPEADTIRRLTKNNHPNHKPIHPVGKFPRAQFGLPIIFEFKREDRKMGDPYTTTLQGEGDFNRMASPIIFRPIKFSKGAAVIALILKWTVSEKEEIKKKYKPPGKLKLIKISKGKVVKEWPVENNVDKSEAKQINPLNGETDPLIAFLSSLR